MAYQTITEESSLRVKIDTHIHTDNSRCGRQSIHDIIRVAKEKGLYAVCITDHDNINIGNEIKEGRQPNGLYVFFGVEYSTKEGEFLIFTENLDKIQFGKSVQYISYFVRRDNGIMIAAHPTRKKRPVDPMVFEHRLCNSIEIFNGHNTYEENQKAFTLFLRPDITSFTNGSDAHRVKDIGREYTWIPEIKTRPELIDCLKGTQWTPS